MTADTTIFAASRKSPDQMPIQTATNLKRMAPGRCSRSIPTPMRSGSVTRCMTRRTTSRPSPGKHPGVEAEDDDIKVNVKAINHFVWVDEVRYQGRDLTDVLDAELSRPRTVGR